MIFITAAMLSEARPLVRQLGLKRIAEETKYQIFTNGDVFLILTGVGGTKAMMATMYLLTRFHAKNKDFLLSVGIAALMDPPAEISILRGRIFLARKIVNTAFDRTCYPDLLYRTCFPEADVVTWSSVYRKNEKDSSTASPYSSADTSADSFANVAAVYPDVPVLADMEACFVYEAAASFLYVHHIFILKIISDDGDSSGITRQAVSDLVECHAGEIGGFLEFLQEEGKRIVSADGAGMSSEDQILLDKLKQTLHLTLYQRNEIQKLAESYACRQKSIGPLIKNLPGGEVKSKKEGKERYEQFRNLLKEP